MFFSVIDPFFKSFMVSLLHFAKCCLSFLIFSYFLNHDYFFIPVAFSDVYFQFCSFVVLEPHLFSVLLLFLLCLCSTFSEKMTLKDTLRYTFLIRLNISVCI